MDSEPAAKVATDAIQAFDKAGSARTSARLLAKAHTIMGLSGAEAAATPLPAALHYFERAVALDRLLSFDDWDLHCHALWRAGEQGRKVVEATQGAADSRIAQDARHRLQGILQSDRASVSLRIAASFELWKLEPALGRPARDERWQEQAEEMAKTTLGQLDNERMSLASGRNSSPTLCKFKCAIRACKSGRPTAVCQPKCSLLVEQMARFRNGYCLHTGRATMPFSLAQAFLRSAAEED